MMNAQAVLERELRALSRRATTWRIRWVAAALAVAGVILEASSASGLGGNGQRLFLTINGDALFFILALTPMLTADLVSRERREGTLPFLFLAGLSARDVLLGKSVAALAGALSVWLGAMPILFLPLLLGGVSAADVAGIITAQASAIVFGLTCGLFASTISTSTGRALAVAYGFTLMIVIAGGLVLGAILVMLASKSVSWAIFIAGTAYLFVVGALFTSAQTDLARWWTNEGWGTRLEENLWSNDLASPRIARQSLPPWFKARVERQLRAWLEDSPLTWLVLRTRVTPGFWLGWPGWWFLFVLMAWLVAEFQGPVRFAPAVLLSVMSVLSVRAYREARRDGTIELLLCTPQLPVAFIRAPLLALLRDFGPALGLHCALLARGTFQGEIFAGAEVFKLLAIAVCLPIVSLWASLKIQNVILAWLLAMAVVGLAVVYLGGIVSALLLAAVASLCWRNSESLLRQRTFALQISGA